MSAGGSLYRAGETVNVTFNGASVATTTADTNGAFATSFSVPSLPAGTYTVAAAGQTSGTTGTAPFTVIAGTPSATATVAATATVGVTPTATSTPQAAPPVSHDNRYFAETSYRVDNDAIWSYFQARGQVDTFGFPVSRTFTLLGCQTQIFQRQVAQVCGNGNPALMNILDPDIFPYTNVNGSTFPAADPTLKGNTPPVSDPTYSTDIINFIRTNAPDTYNSQPVNYGMTFFNSITPAQAGISDPNLLPLLDLEVWGAPISQPMADPNNAGFIYQRFQRGIMHYTVGQGTRGILLADYLKSVMRNANIPGDLAAQAAGTRFFAQYCPSSPAWLCRPGDLPGTDLTFAFEPG